MWRFSQEQEQLLTCRHLKIANSRRTLIGVLITTELRGTRSNDHHSFPQLFLCKANFPTLPHLYTIYTNLNIISRLYGHDRSGYPKAVDDLVFTFILVSDTHGVFSWPFNSNFGGYLGLIRGSAYGHGNQGFFLNQHRGCRDESVAIFFIYHVEHVLSRCVIHCKFVSIHTA